MRDVLNAFDLGILEAAAGNIVVQTTAIFCVGVLVARYLERRPARAHTVLLLATIAALAVPLASAVVRQVGWGVLPPAEVGLDAHADDPAPWEPEIARADAFDERSGMSIVLGQEAMHGRRGRFDMRGAGQVSPAGSSAEPVPPARFIPPVESLEATASPQPAAATWWAWRLAVGCWLLGSLWLVARLVRGVVVGRRLLAASARCSQPEVTAALSVARERLELVDTRVDIFESHEVRCPMIWCWGRFPRLLLPAGAAAQWSAATWAPILCHELAHWKRRDHWAALVGETACCLLPWQPLAWWTKRRMEQASELACDDWTVATGHSPVDYAETLLGLVAQADPPLALAALRRRSGLAGRIQHILSEAVPHPRLGRAWAVAVMVLAVTAVCATAFCQRGLARADAPPAEQPALEDESDEPAENPATEPAAAGEAAQESSAENGPAENAPNEKASDEKASDEKASDEKASDEKAPNAEAPAEGTSPAPIAAAAAPAAGMAKQGAPQSTATPGGSPVPPMAAEDEAGDKPARHHVYGRVTGMDDKPIAGADVYWAIREKVVLDNNDWTESRVIASTKTNDDGLYKLDAELVRNQVINSELVVRAAGHGIHAMNLHLTALTPQNIQLRASYPVEGTIYTPNGEPVVGAEVKVSYIAQHPNNEPGFYLQLQDLDRPLPYWPEAVVTDSEGKFRLDDVMPHKARGSVCIQAADFALTEVPFAHPDSIPDNSREAYREPNFMLVLEPPIVVNGRFVDEATGEPIAGANIEVQPYMNHARRNAFAIKATSGADGRYTMRVGSADLYFVKVFPPRGYPAVRNSFSPRRIERLAGTKRQLDYEVKLRRGLMLAGRVIDADTGEGVPKAEVHYKPEVGRKLGANTHFDPVTTADDGTFEATAVDGKGFLLVNAPGGYYRLAVLEPRVEHYHEGIYPHGMLEIDVPTEGPAEPYTIGIHKGPPLILRVLDPEGNPVAGELRAACGELKMEGFFSGHSCQNGTFRLEAAQPGRTYRVFLFAMQSKSGAVVEVEAPADGQPIDVRLQPCATVRGRYVYMGGAPAPEVTNFTKFRLYTDREPRDNERLNLPFYGNFAGYEGQQRVTDADGNFILDGIVPGAFIYLGVNYAFDNGEREYEVGELQPGEVRDLGDLVIH